MALIDNPSSRLSDAHPRATLPPLPLAALGRLPQLHAESSEARRQMEFLKSAVNAAGALMLLGMAALAFVAGTALQPCFAWALLVLLGVGALLRSYIRSIAAGFDRAPMAEAAKDLRAILFYSGFAWGSGALLVLSPVSGPIPALLFAVLPCLSLSLLLKDQGGTLAFLAPVTALTIAAAILRPWPEAGLDTALLLALQSGIAAHAVLRNRRMPATVPAGLALR